MLPLGKVVHRSANAFFRIATTYEAREGGSMQTLSSLRRHHLHRALAATGGSVGCGLLFGYVEFWGLLETYDRGQRGCDTKILSWCTAAGVALCTLNAFRHGMRTGAVSRIISRHVPTVPFDVANVSDPVLRMSSNEWFLVEKTQTRISREEHI